MGFGQIEALEHGGVRLAYERQDGVAPTLVWLGGFKSDMEGTKAEALAAWARDRGQGFVRFDYSGHGRSDGAFEDGTISRWLADALAVIDQLTAGPLVLVGSSMGGWLALLAARARAERVAGLLLIAPAADFTERLIWDTFNAAERRTIVETGRLVEPSQYSPEPNVITLALIEDGRRHLLMDRPYPFDGSIHILQGSADPDVPEAHVRALAKVLPADRVRFELIAGGDHRLSRPQDLERLVSAAKGMAEALAR